MLVLFSALRRELSYLPELFIPDGFIFMNHTYEWWEDSFLLTVTLIALGSLIYSWRYVSAVLRHVPKLLYIVTGTLVVIQYLGENAIGFEHTAGIVAEELSEMCIYLIALVYLWRFPVHQFELDYHKTLNKQKNIDCVAHNHIRHQHLKHKQNV